MVRVRFAGASNKRCSLVQLSIGLAVTTLRSTSRRVMFNVEDIDDTLARLVECGVEVNV